MSVTVFLSSVSDEFGADRKQLRGDFTRHDIHVKEQDEFKDLGRGTLAKLDEYVVHSDAVVHLVGKLAGASPGEADENALLEKYPRLATKFPPLEEALKDGGLSYTQWEAWLALYHDKVLLIAKAPGDLGAGQAKHLARLKAAERFPCCEFTSADNLAKQLYAHGILDLLVKDYAEAAARERDVALGFIHEMASKVAGDRNLDLDGKKQAVRNAIEIYEKEIAGGLTQTNFGDIVDTALAKAKRQVDKGQSGLARATLRKAAEDMRRDEEERRASYVAGVTELCNRARDIALASYDGEAAAEAVVALADAVHGVDRAGVFEALWTETNALLDHGSDKGSNVHLVAAIALSRKLRDAASTPGERGTAHLWLGHALMRLGERERERARLMEAVAAYREALKECARKRVPLGWAMTQNNLGNALATLGERESGTARLNEAVAAYREALKEFTRERVALDWATTQNNLGNALQVLGERETGTARLNEALAAYREALKERKRDRVPLDWAMTQNNLGNALTTLGKRESGMARLDEAVAAYREALKERPRDRVPLYWATTWNNLGETLQALGEREGGTARLEQAVAAYREALMEFTLAVAPYWHDLAQQNLAECLALLEQRRKS